MADSSIARFGLEIGLDLDELNYDFDAADLTIKEEMKRLNKEAKEIRVKAEIDLSAMEASGSEIDKLKIKQKAFNAELDIQNEKLEILKKNWIGAYDKFGAESDTMMDAFRAYRRQQDVVAGLQRKKDATDFSLSNLASAAKGNIAGIAITGIAAIGAGLVSLTRDAIKAGEAVHGFGEELDVSGKEATELSQLLSLGGVDQGAFVSFTKDLRKNILSAGKAGNETTRTLARFGITLTDDSGAIVSYNEQLKRLAAGYQNAKAAGATDEFVDALGAQGKSILPILREWETLQKDLSTTSISEIIDPEAAHTAHRELQKLGAEWDTLKDAATAALVPLANELLPVVTGGVKKLIEAVKSLNDSFNGSFDAANAESLEDLLTSQELDYGDLDSMGGLELAKYNRFLKQRAKMNRAAEEAEKNETSQLWGTLKGDTPLTDARLEGLRKERDVTEQINRALSESTSKRLREEIEAIKSKTLESIANGEKESEAWIKAEKEIAEAVKNAHEEAAKANESLQDSIFRLSHSDFDVSIYDVDKAAKAMRDRGAAEELIARETALKKSKITQQFEEQTAAYLDGIYETSLNQRLNQIEREKQAWIKKGMDEVTATRAAEEQKRQAMAQSAKNAMTSQRLYLEAYAKGGEKALKALIMKQDKYDPRLLPYAQGLEGALKNVNLDLYGGAGDIGGQFAGLIEPSRNTADNTRGILEYLTTGKIETAISAPYREMAGQIQTASGSAMEKIRGSLDAGFSNVGREIQVIRGTQLSGGEWQQNKIQVIRGTQADGETDSPIKVIRGTQPGEGYSGHPWQQPISSDMPQLVSAMNTAMAQAAPVMTQQFSAAMNSALSPLATGQMKLGSPEIISSMTEIRGALNQITQALGRLAAQKTASGQPNITVDIGTAVTPDSEAMTWLADTVAEKITPVVQRAIGSDNNSY